MQHLDILKDSALSISTAWLITDMVETIERNKP